MEIWCKIVGYQHHYDDDLISGDDFIDDDDDDNGVDDIPRELYPY